MTLGFFSGTLTPSQWHDGVALLQRRSGIAYDGVKMPLRRTKSATPSCQ